jgi:hypothetical protein
VLLFQCSDGNTDNKVVSSGEMSRWPTISTASNSAEGSNDITRRGEDMNEERKSACPKHEFMRLAGIGPELAEFVTEFIKKPEILFSMSLERGYEIENQMDAILSLFEH